MILEKSKKKEKHRKMLIPLAVFFLAPNVVNNNSTLGMQSIKKKRCFHCVKNNATCASVIAGSEGRSPCPPIPEN